MPYDSSAAPAAPSAEELQLCADLSDVAAALLAPFRPIEDELLEVGGQLAATSDILNRLTAIFESLPETLDGERVREATRHLGDIAREAPRLAAALTRERAELERLHALSSDVGARIDRLRRTVGAISVLSINARIAATQVSAKGEDFSVYTAEIGRLANAAKETIERFASDHERLAEAFVAARANVAEFERKHGATLKSVAQNLEDALASVTTHREQSEAAVAEIGARSRRIAQGVSTVVQALQIGDITRQRIEHVSAALRMLADGLGARPDGAWYADLPPSERGPATAAVCRLQSAQIAKAADDFAAETERTATALAGLAFDAAEVVRLGTQVYGADSRRNGSFLTVLAAELRTADGLIRETQEARREVDGMAAEIAGALTELLSKMDQVSRIEIDMRLVGLNTTLRCGRLGHEGRTLGAIAQELRGYANKTVEDAHAVMEGLRSVAAAAASLSGGGSERGADRIGVIERETAASAAALEAAGESLSTALATLAGEGTRAARMLRVPSEARTRAVRALCEARERLDRGTRPLPVSDGDLAVRERVQALLGSRYTMASERAMHAMFDGPAQTVDAVRPGPSVATDVGLDDILF